MPPYSTYPWKLLAAKHVDNTRGADAAFHGDNSGAAAGHAPDDYAALEDEYDEEGERGP